MFCVCPSHCISRRERNKKNAKVDADHRTSLLGDTKRVSIARGPYINVRFAMRNFFNFFFLFYFEAWKLEIFIKNIVADGRRVADVIMINGCILRGEEELSSKILNSFWKAFQRVC